MAGPSHAELLELLHDADRSFRTLRATIRTWRDEERYQEAFRRYAEARAEAEGSAFAVMVAVSREPREPEPAERLVRLWLEPPARMREEVEGRWPGIDVRDGSRLFQWSPRMGAIASDPAGNVGLPLGQHPLLFRPRELLGRVELEIAGPATAAGRAAIRVRARPRGADQRLPDGVAGIAPGAEEYELIVDAERGVQLGMEARAGGVAFDTVEVEEIAFDEPLDPTLFTFEPPAGEPLRAPEEAFGSTDRWISIEQAVELAPFTLFLPASVPDGWQLSLGFHGAGAAAGGALLTADYFDFRTTDHVSFHERPAGASFPPAGWEWLEGATEPVAVPRETACSALTDLGVLVERERTWIELRSRSFGRERLVDLAASLVPVDGRRPPLPA